MRTCAVIVAVFLTGGFLQSQEFESPKGKKKDLDDRLESIEDDLSDLRKDLKKKKDEDSFADGILTLGGGAKLRFGGKLEMLLIDAESDTIPGLGATFTTDEPDPHFLMQRLRLEPVIDLNRWISVRGQLDFRVSDGDTVLKELVARHDSQPLWWLRSSFQIGLDDRFIRPARRTKGYPLIGNAFWRDESVALTWALRAGHRRGLAAARASDEKGRRNQSRGGAATEGFDGEFDTDDVSDKVGDAPLGPFDFGANPGEFQLVLSLGQGYELGTNEVNFDSAAFNNLVQDDRELSNDLALRELGIGAGWRRSFEALGELGVFVFFYDDELRDSSIQFLQGPSLTSRLPDNTVIAGYGDSSSDKSTRQGITVEYFLPAESIFESLGVKTRKRDGLRVLAQFIDGDDGELERRGWYVQGSYRVSFGKLIADRYFRSFEPIVRYGMLEVDVPAGRSIALPGTWDRDALMIGGILEVTGEIFIKVEYTLNDETTGGSEVDNDELLVQILINFG